MIHHTYDSRVFVPSTEATPGKSGIVPAPPIINPKLQHQSFLASDATWRELAWMCFGEDLASLDGSLGIAGQDSNTCDANKCVKGGIYHSSDWTNAPQKTGMLINFQVRQSPDVQRYALIQLFFSYMGVGQYRTTIFGGMENGRLPSDEEWEYWLPIAMSIPTVAHQSGQLEDLQHDEGIITHTLSEGGAWLCWAVWEGTANYKVVGNVYGIYPGGTVLSDPRSSSVAIRMRGWAWRIF